MAKARRTGPSVNRGMRTYCTDTRSRCSVTPQALIRRSLQARRAALNPGSGLGICRPAAEPAQAASWRDLSYQLWPACHSSLGGPASAKELRVPSYRLGRTEVPSGSAACGPGVDRFCSLCSRILNFPAGRRHRLGLGWPLPAVRLHPSTTHNHASLPGSRRPDGHAGHSSAPAERAAGRCPRAASRP